MISLNNTKKLFLLKYKNIKTKLITLKQYKILCSMVFEKSSFFWNCLFFQNFTSRKKYLWEKFRSKKEKLSRLKTFAWKNEGKFSTFKGFYIPANLPQTEQAKFFQKRRDEDEQKLWDKYINTKKFNLSDLQYKESIETDPTIQNLQLFQLKKLSNFEQIRIWNIVNTNLSDWILKDKTKILSAVNDKNLIIKKNKFITFKLKFSKWFFKSQIFKFKVVSWQHLWSYYNLGFNTADFLNFFLIQAYPMFFVNFNFIKIKLLLIKKFKNILLKDSYYLKLLFSNKNLIIANLKFIFNLKTSLSPIIINKLFFFLKIYSSWFDLYETKFFSKITLFSIFIFHHKKTFTGKLIYFFYLIFKNFFTSNKQIKIFLNNILINRLKGAFNLNFSKSKNRRKYIHTTTFLTFKKNIFSTIFFKLLKKYLPLVNFYKKINLQGLHNFIFLLESVFLNFEFVLWENSIFQRTNSILYLEKFSNTGYNLENDFFVLSRNLSKTFFQFLKNWVRHYEQIRFFFYTSFSHQVKILNEFNVADILFWFIIWRGKKLTARRVFLKFLKKFKKWYALPPLLIFTHALLLVEPKIWLKEKKIAGKQYNIPIYISSNWSKRIAIRWLLQAAKKWKWASITESLSQEVWDACFKKGGAFSNKENLHLTAKWNKAYMRWF